eukprot:2658549-Pleurochrysis_carterae.AAC.1
MRPGLRAGARSGLRPNLLRYHAADIAARVLAALAAANNMRMRRWDFVAAYLQGELQDGEVVYCYAPPGYAAYGADGRPRICR